jgi:hypothetical protein
MASEGMGTAWARHAICESAFIELLDWMSILVYTWRWKKPVLKNLRTSFICLVFVLFEI